MANKKHGSLTDARRVVLTYIDEHTFLPDYVKPLAKEVAIRHFHSLSSAIGNLELAARRAEMSATGAIKHRRKPS